MHQIQGKKDDNKLVLGIQITNLQNELRNFVLAFTSGKGTVAL